MNIGIDAKRIFLNHTGLGSYGRNLINGLNQVNIEDDFNLYTPKKTKLFNTNPLNSNYKTKTCNSFSKAFWRSYAINNDLKKDDINIYHGISNELPFALDSKIKSIVDIHDLLFIRFPKFYHYFDRQIFKYKTQSACNSSNIIIATSISTKNDIVNYYNINPNKIEVVYQSCADEYFEKTPKEHKQNTLTKYKLPNDYILCVGTIQERKNQKQILEALKISKHKIPLVLIGGGKKYKEDLIEFALKNKLELIIPNSFVADNDLPAIYQSAKAFVFPGLSEGFGIPIVEAMASQIPVITSFNTSMAEIVQDTKCLINPLSPEDIADKIDDFLDNPNEKIIEDNYNRAQYFRNIEFAKRVNKIYKSLK